MTGRERDSLCLEGSTDNPAVTDGGSPPALPGQENQPTDPDGDGLYEDINGDGELTVGDVQMLLTHRDTDVVRANAEFFNFSGTDPGMVTTADIEALYQLLQNDD
jgi:PKD repeat protein